MSEKPANQNKNQIQDISDVKECPICHSTDTVYRKANEFAIKAGKAPLYIEAALIPLDQPGMAVLVNHTLIKYFDDCAQCGIRYCVHSQVITTAIGGSAQQAMAQMLGKSNGPMGPQQLKG
jgi:hypothetical protein